jgi:hypothetical protein
VEELAVLLREHRHPQPRALPPRFTPR